MAARMSEAFPVVTHPLQSLLVFRESLVLPVQPHAARSLELSRLILLIDESVARDLEPTMLCNRASRGRTSGGAAATRPTGGTAGARYNAIDAEVEWHGDTVAARNQDCDLREGLSVVGVAVSAPAGRVEAAQGMNPPEPAIGTHQRSLGSVAPAGPEIWTRSWEPPVSVTSTDTPALVGTTVFMGASLLCAWLRFTPIIA